MHLHVNSPTYGVASWTYAAYAALLVVSSVVMAGVPDDLLAVLNTSTSRRARALEQWFTAQPAPAVAARTLAEWLGLLEDEPYSAPGARATTALLHFLSAEKIRHPLADAAEAADDPEVAARLFAHASTSSLILGELADLPYCYARQAILTGSTSAWAWDAFRDSLYTYTTDLFGDIEEWRGRDDLPLHLVPRALDVAEQCARDWSEEDRERLAELTRA